MSWKGFEENDDDKHDDREERVEPRQTLGGDKRVNLRAKKNMTRERLLQAAADQKVTEVLDVPPEALLSKPVKPPVKEPAKPSESPTKAAQVKLKIADGKCEVFPSAESPMTSTTTSTTAAAATTATTASDETPSQDCDVTKVELETKQDSSVKSDPTTKVPEDKMSKLELFEVKQKLIEEQNRKRKELLTAAINDRRRQTSQETKKLQYIQEELQKIDNLLTTDVKFLRNSIEQASVDFSEAQKRYDKAEKEFIDAKMNLFRIMERKELLTDHLCSIIEQNEMRKAKKLTELMEKLNIDSDETVFEKNEEFSLQDLRESAEFNTLKKLDQVENKPDDL